MGTSIVFVDGGEWVVRCLEILIIMPLDPYSNQSYEILINVQNIFIVMKTKYK